MRIQEPTCIFTLPYSSAWLLSLDQGLLATRGTSMPLTDVGNRIEKELDRLGRMEKLCMTQFAGTRMGSVGRSARRRRLSASCVRKAQSTLRLSTSRLQEEDVERESPITLPNGSLDEAIRSLPLSAGSVKRS